MDAVRRREERHSHSLLTVSIISNETYYEYNDNTRKEISQPGSTLCVHMYVYKGIHDDISRVYICDVNTGRIDSILVSCSDIYIYNTSYPALGVGSVSPEKKTELNTF